MILMNELAGIVRPRGGAPSSPLYIYSYGLTRESAVLQALGLRVHTLKNVTRNRTIRYAISTSAKLPVSRMPFVTVSGQLSQ